MEESVLKLALRAWVRKGSGLSDGSILWAEQNATRPPVPFITMRLGDLTPLGSADELTQTYDATRPEGEEVELTVQGSRSFVLSVQCFGNGAQSSRKILSQAVTSLGLPSVRAAFEAAGLSCYDAGPVQNITDLLETAFEPRSAVEVYFYCSEAVSERTTFIETVEVEDETRDNVFTVPQE